jgi:3-dehydroquinate synthetase
MAGRSEPAGWVERREYAGAVDFTVTAKEETEFRVLIQDDFLDHPELLGPVGKSPKRIIVTDPFLYERFGQRIADSFRAAGLDPVFLVFEVTSENKNWATLGRAVAELVNMGIKRRSEPVWVFGGGALTDLFGFALSMVARGLHWYRVVTTGQMIDAGTSIKVGADVAGKKSAVGGFHAPKATFIDRRFLATVPDVLISDMMAEAVKAALVCHSALYHLIAQHGRSLMADRLQGATPEADRTARKFLDWSVHASLADNAPNMREEELERLLHLGHTWGAKVEVLSRETAEPWTHGQSVSADMALSVVIAGGRGMMTHDEVNGFRRLVRDLGLATWHPLMSDPEVMRQAHESAIQARDGELLAPIPVGIGRAEFISDITLEEVLASAGQLRDHWR